MPEKKLARAPVYDRRLHARVLVAAGHPVAAVAALFGEDPKAVSTSGAVNHIVSRWRNRDQ